MRERPANDGKTARQAGDLSVASEMESKLVGGGRPCPDMLEHKAQQSKVSLGVMFTASQLWTEINRATARICWREQAL